MLTFCIGFYLGGSFLTFLMVEGGLLNKVISAIFWPTWPLWPG